MAGFGIHTITSNIKDIDGRWVVDGCTRHVLSDSASKYLKFVLFI